jgi:TBC1 domain family member 2
MVLTLTLSFYFKWSTYYVDPLYLIARRPRAERAEHDDNVSTERSRTQSPDSPARLAREQSIRSNRRRKFIDCLAADDVDMGAHQLFITARSLETEASTGQLRKYAWAGIPNELRPIAWPLLLVSFAACSL